MRIILLSILFLTSSIQMFAQDIHEFSEEKWLGIWKGSLQIIYPSSTQWVSISLEISKTETPGRYSWKTVYGEAPKALEKKYFIYAKDEAKGQWILDEDNEILIDLFLADNVFYSLFEVKGSILNSIYTNNGSSIIFEVLSCKSDTPNVTGKSDDEVKSYPVFVIQKAVLTR